MNKITLEIKLYGAFRKFGDSIKISVPKDSDMERVKSVLSKNLSELVNDSVLANDNEILPKTYVFKQDMMLSILPPVCGG